MTFESCVSVVPVLKIERVYHRPGAIWPFTSVGRPPQEDTSFGELIHELTGPIIPTVLPGIHAVNAVDAAGVHPLLLAIGSERWLLLRKLEGDFTSHVKDLQRLLRSGDIQRAEEVALAYKSVDGNVVAAGLEEAARGPEAAEEAMAAALGLERRRLERRLLFLGTVGNNAPFVGLLGTVIGIILAFDELSRAGASAAACTLQIRASGYCGGA